MVGKPAIHDWSIGRGIAIAAGVSFAAFPAFGPLIALLAVSTGRIEVQRADRWWWVASALLAVPFLVTGSARTSLLTAGQVLAVWLVFRAAVELRRVTRRSTFAVDMGFGLVIGLAVTLALGLSRIDGFEWRTSFTALDAIVWRANPAVFGHSMFVLSALLAVIVPSPRLRVLSLALGAAGVLASGSREAVFAWLIVAIGLPFLRLRGSRRVWFIHWFLVVLMAVSVSGLGTFIGVGRAGFLTSLVSETPDSNMFRGTEIAAADWWHALGVEHRSIPVVLHGERRTGFVVTKVRSEPWSRLQQGVVLQPHATYTLSAAWLAPAELRPGLDGWGVSGPEEAPAVVSTTRSSDTMTARSSASGPMVVLDQQVMAIDDGWQRASVTFRYEGDRPLVWYTGVVVDRSDHSGGRITFAELQLTESDELIAYVPGIAERGVTDIRASRFPIWRDALRVFVQRPWFGWGAPGLPEATRDLWPDEQAVRPGASHAHNMLLDVLVKQGIVGGAGLLVLFALLALRAVQQRDRPMVLILMGVAILNAFDTTLLSGEVIYPLAAVLGWRAVGRREIARAETGVGSASAVRAVLAATEALAGGAALAISIVISGWWDPSIAFASNWSASLAYGAALWPVLAAWSGLHPGYGRPAYDELARSVRAAAAATVLLGFGTLVLPNAFDLPPSVLVLTGLISVILLPAFRALTKLVLRAMRLWGRPVVLLGTGPDAERTARHLLDHPGIGLHPVAVFGEGARWSLDALPITGDLEHAWSFLRAHNVRHAIVTPDAAGELGFDEVLRRADRQLRYVHYLPDLRGLPTNSVAAAPLGTALGLEVRNQLASGANRAVKRAMDLVGSGLLLTILGLPLVLIAIAIRLDSRGPALYLSPRLGRYGRTFRCVKFRTMHVDAEERLERLLAKDDALREEYEHFHKLRDDPRVTRLGQILRRGSIDELPQLLNVFRGDMSLVGPRPYLVRELGEMGPLKDLIFLARPGMTGYWQTEARNDVGFEERQVMEAHYVRNWSVWWDIEILLRTPSAVRNRTGK